MAEDQEGQDHMARDHQTEDASAHDAAAEAETSSTVSRMGSTAPPRTKSLIEAEAIRTGETASDVSVDTVAAADHAAEPSFDSETSESAPGLGETPVAVSMEREPRRGGSLWPVAAAIVLGAAISVGGAYGLHQLDNTGTSVAALQTRVGALEQANTNVASLQSNVTALTEKLAELDKKAQATGTTLAQQQEALQALQEAVKQAPKDTASGTPSTPPAESAPVDLGPLTGRVDKLEQQVAGLDQRITELAAKLESDMRDAQSQKDAATQAVLTHAQADARAILASTLRRKVEAGEAYTDEFAALSSRGADKAKLDALAPFAASGVPTPAALDKQFAAARPAIFATHSEPKPDGFFARIVQDAGHLVRIHKVGDTKGTDLPAQVARIDAALGANHLDEALREWNALPAAAQAKSQAFADTLRHRIAAVEAAKAVEADALAALAKAKS
jgi:hypothetical protein